MTTYTDRISGFIIGSDMSDSLASAVIERFEGEECFLDVYLDVIRDGINIGYGDWFASKSLADFFEVNKADIIDYISELARQDGFDSYVKYISKFSILNEGDIKMAFVSDQSDNYILTVVAVCHFVAEQACRDYAAINGDEY